MIDKDTEQKILAEYDASAHTYAILAPKLEQLLRDILRERGIEVHTISSRAKGRKSLVGKLAKDNAKYEKLADLTDLVGLRITTYFAEDVDRVAAVIAEEFDIDPENSVDKRQSLASDRFGYLSLHHVLSLKDSRCELTEYKAFKGLKLELQTRSVLQHAWAEIEHDLGYKSEIEVPQHIRRRFALVAGLLELADREFDGIKKELESYRKEVAVAVQKSPKRVSLNLDSMRVLLETESVVTKLDNKIMDISAIPWSDFSPTMDTDLKRVKQMGIKSIGMLTEILQQQENVILVFSKYWDKDLDPSEQIGIGVSIYYLWLLWIANNYGDSMEEVLEREGHYDPDIIARRLQTAIVAVKAELLAEKTKL